MFASVFKVISIVPVDKFTGRQVRGLRRSARTLTLWGGSSNISREFVSVSIRDEGPNHSDVLIHDRPLQTCIIHQSIPESISGSVLSSVCTLRLRFRETA